MLPRERSWSLVCVLGAIYFQTSTKSCFQTPTTSKMTLILPSQASPFPAARSGQQSPVTIVFSPRPRDCLDLSQQSPMTVLFFPIRAP